MSRFRYRLQSALDRSLDDERAAQRELARAQAVLAAHRRSVALLEARAAETREALAISVVTSASILIERNRQLDGLELARQNRLTDVAAASRAVAASRAALDRVARRRCALERHRERKAHEHASREALRELAEIDESNAASIALT